MNNGSSFRSHYQGLIDEVDIYNRALSDEEITAIYNAGSAGKCTAPPEQFTLTVTKAGTGTGTVTAGANCTLNWVGNTGTCTVSDGTAITLSGAANAGSTFSGWSGGTGSASGCSGTGNCTFNITAASGVTATFTLNQYTVTATAGSGGTISPASRLVSHGSTTTFTVTPNTGYTASVGGTCGGTLVGTTYTTNAITANCTVSATFTLNTYTLTVTKAGTGSGTVTSNPAGINCGTTCNKVYNHGTSVTLTAKHAKGSIFTGWSGGCTGTATICVVSMNAAKSVTATFNKASRWIRR